MPDDGMFVSIVVEIQMTLHRITDSAHSSLSTRSDALVFVAVDAICKQVRGAGLIIGADRSAWRDGEARYHCMHRVVC